MVPTTFGHAHPDEALPPSYSSEGSSDTLDSISSVSSACACRPTACQKPGIRLPVLGVATLLGQVALVAYLAADPDWGEWCQLVERNWRDLLMYFGASVIILSFAVVFAHASQEALDAVTKRGKCYAFCSAAFLLIMSIEVLTVDVWNSCPGLWTTKVINVVFEAFAQITYALLVFNFFGLVEERVRLTEVGFSDDLGSLSLWRLRLGYVALEVALSLTLICAKCVSFATESWAGLGVFTWSCMQIHNSLSSLCYLSIGCIAFRCFTSVQLSMDAKTSSFTSYVHREKRWAQKVMGYLRWITLLQCGLSAMLHAALVPMYFSGALLLKTQLVYGIGQTLLFLMDITFLLTITGLIRPKRSAFQSEKLCTGSSSSSFTRRTLAWEAKVKELAGRCVSAGALLDFYEVLGLPDGPMPHYRSEHSTTNYVVRQAIIPLTRTSCGGGSTFAELHLSPGVSCLPQVMVTHTWTGLFVDLVASVAAEACGQDEYGRTAKELSTDGCRRLRQVLARNGALGRTYWICAFCVNQHAGICDSLGRPPPVSSLQFAAWDRGRRDSVTGDVYPVCSCSQPKCLNDSSPEACEMNKFDDMMRHLKHEVDGFVQLVSVDREYAVFTRAWCVAELHMAHKLGMEQKVCLHMNRVLDVDAGDLDVYKKLATLTVTACKASRPQDREEILSRIGNQQEFDEQLQEVIFGNRGLLRRNFKGFGVLEAAARTAFRVNRAQSSLSLQLAERGGQTWNRLT